MAEVLFDVAEKIDENIDRNGQQGKLDGSESCCRFSESHVGVSQLCRRRRLGFELLAGRRASINKLPTFFSVFLSAVSS